MNKISLTCPKCNANLSEDSNKRSTYCVYCGTQIFVGDGIQLSEQINRTIDEARIKEAELGLEQLRYQAQLRDQDKRTAKIVVGGVLSIVAVCIIVVVAILLMNANRIISDGTYTDYIGIKY